MPASALRTKLSDFDLDKLKTVAFQRLNDLRAERAAQGMERRMEKFEKISASDFGHRTCSDSQAQTIFDRSNQSLQIVRSIARFLKARMAKDLFGSTPWFAARPEGPASFVLASEIQKHADWKLLQGDYKAVAKKALEVALDLGWVALKTTWRTESDISETMQSILFDPEGTPPPDDESAETAPDDESQEGETAKAGPGAPVTADNGDYIQESDETQEVPTMDGDGNPVPDDDGQPSMHHVFTKAPGVTPPHPTNKLKFKPHLVSQDVRLYYGIDVQPIYWKDILWPINAPKMDLTHCDCIAHTREMTKQDILAAYDPEGDDPYVSKILDNLQNGSTEPKAESNKPKAQYRESTAVNNDQENPTFKVTEMYMRRVLPGNTKPSRILVVLLEERQEIVWCEYLAAISPQSECPIHLVPVNKVPGRAYGRGLFEIFEMAAEVADRILNSVLWRNAQNSDPTKFWNPNLTEEGADTPLTIEPGKTYTVKGQNKASDVLSTVEIPDLDERSWQLMELFMQLVQTESGVTNANQGDMSDLPSNNTATGVNSLLESSSVLHFDVLEDLRDGINPQLQYAIELIYFRQDQDETYEYLEGDDEAVLTLQQADQIRQLPMHVEILLTRAKQQEMRDSALSCIPHGWNFWQAVRSDPVAALHMLPLYLQVFRAQEIDNPESFFPKPAELQAQIQQMQAQQQAAAMAAQQAPPDEEPPAGAPAQTPQGPAPSDLGASALGPVAQPSDPGAGAPAPEPLPRNVSAV